MRWETKVTYSSEEFKVNISVSEAITSSNTYFLAENE